MNFPIVPPSILFPLPKIGPYYGTGKSKIDLIKDRVRDAQKNYEKNLASVESILNTERSYVSRAPVNEPIIALMSGGLDSTVMVSKIIEDWKVKVYPLFINRGARAKKYEEKAFDYFVSFFQQRFPENFLAPYKLEVEIPPREMKESFPMELALTTGHPLRNSTMQNLAVMYAVSLIGKGIEAKTIFSGSVAEDNTEPELGLLSLRAQTLNTCISLADWSWQITSPLTDPNLTKKTINKPDLIAYSMEKFIPLDKTRTCFSSDKLADGACHACKKRLEAFAHLGMKDPAEYKASKEEI